MAQVNEPGTRAWIAAETYKAEVWVEGWSISFGAFGVDEEGNSFVATTFVRDHDNETVKPDPGVFVWGPSREDQMDPETSGTIAAACVAEDILTRHRKRAKPC